jgi:hypothetical protein
MIALYQAALLQVYFVSCLKGTKTVRNAAILQKLAEYLRPPTCLLASEPLYPSHVDPRLLAFLRLLSTPAAQISGRERTS